MPEGLTLKRQDAIATLTLDRASKRNAMTQAMWTELPALIAIVAADDGAMALRLEGAGDHFCGGADIAEFPDVYGTPERIAAYNQAIKQAVAALAAFQKPSFAVIRGACVGGGMSLALACDHRFAASDARFAITPAKLGLVYNHGDTKRLVDAVGASFAKDMLFTGRTVPASEALAAGLVNRIAPPDELEALVAGHVAQLAMVSRSSLAGIKAMVGAIEAGADAETPALAKLFSDGFASADFAEGYRAFIEKRPPRFGG